jgi:hypothetical protein
MTAATSNAGVSAATVQLMVSSNAMMAMTSLAMAVT